MTEDEWKTATKGMLKAEITRRNLTYDQLSERLAEMGIRETPTNLRTKISRGNFGTVFFLQALRAAGCDRLDLSTLPK